MRLWRLAREAHSALNGEGARMFGGRWNSPGLPAVYCAGSAALAILEVRVHLDLPLDLLPEDYRLFAIDAENIDIEDAPSQAVDAPRTFGDEWLASGRSAILKVPSIIIPEEWNALINPLHPQAQGIRLVSQRPFQFDSRLF